MPTPDQSPTTPEGLIHQVVVEEVLLSDDELAQLQANSEARLGIADVDISPNVWRVSGEPDMAKETLLGLQTLIGFVSRSINLGGHFGTATHEASQADQEDVYSGFIYSWAYQMSPETIEQSRQYLANKTNDLLTQLQSPHQL